MKNQALVSSKDKNKKLKCHLLQFLFCVLRVKMGKCSLIFSRKIFSKYSAIQIRWENCSVIYLPERLEFSRTSYSLTKYLQCLKIGFVNCYSLWNFY